jgi:hypothetical protein
MKRKAFSLLEFLILIAIVSVFAAILLPMCFPSTTNREVDGYVVKVIDGCEYLMFSSHNHWDIGSHKGNCTNQIHYESARRLME